MPLLEDPEPFSTLDNLSNFQDEFGTKLREKVKMRYIWSEDVCFPEQWSNFGPAHCDQIVLTTHQFSAENLKAEH